MPVGPVELTLASSGDLAALYALDHLATAGDRERLVELRDAVASGRTTVARVDQRVGGYAVTAPWFFGATFVQLLYVAAGRRRSGLGARLLNHLVDAAPGAVFTSTNRSNAPMQHLLTREGWQPCGILHGLDEGDPELFFRHD